MRRLTVVLGTPVDEVSLPEAVERIVDFARDRSRLHQVVTANADFAARARTDPHFHAALLEADLVTADGMPVVWASRLLGGAVPERVTGADLVPALARRCAQEGLSIYLLGARPEVSSAAAGRLAAQCPGLRLAGVHSPPVADLSAMDHAGILRRIRAARPDILLVAFGSPKQELWIRRHAGALPVPVAIGVGASLDFLAGRVRRAPEWMQRAGAEWLWRLGNEPRRLWRRYAYDAGAFGAPLARQVWAARRLLAARQPSGGDAVWLAEDGVLRVRGRLTTGLRDPLAAAAEPPWRAGSSITVSLRECTAADGAGLGALVALAHQTRAAGGEFRLTDVPPSIRRLLRLCRLEAFLRCPPPAEVLPHA